MPDKFENATLLLRIRLPSTLIRIKRSTKTELFENALQSRTIWKRYFFVLVWTENVLYPQLLEYADVILSCNLSSQVFNMAKNMIFSVFFSWQYLSSLIAYFELNIALLRQRTRNNFFSGINGKGWATPRYRSCEKIHIWIRLALRVCGGTKVVGPEEWRENFRMTRKNLLKLKLPNFESKQPPKTL